MLVDEKKEIVHVKISEDVSMADFWIHLTLFISYVVSFILGTFCGKNEDDNVI